MRLAHSLLKMQILICWYNRLRFSFLAERCLRQFSNESSLVWRGVIKPAGGQRRCDMGECAKNAPVTTQDLIKDNAYANTSSRSLCNDKWTTPTNISPTDAANVHGARPRQFLHAMLFCLNDLLNLWSEGKVIIVDWIERSAIFVSYLRPRATCFLNSGLTTIMLWLRCRASMSRVEFFVKIICQTLHLNLRLAFFLIYNRRECK